MADEAPLWSDAEWRAAMTSAEINDLPDSDFAYIEDGGEKDSEGKTTPRNLRHYPVHDEAHARNALSRASAAIEGDDADAKVIAEKAMPKILAACKKFGIEVSDEAKALGALNTLAAADTKTCPTCDGSGKIKAGTTTCPTCGGDGEVAADYEAKANAAVTDEPLPAAMRGELRGVPETRVANGPQFELREVPNGTGGTNLRFTGFASVTGDDAAYEMEDWLGPWTESVGVSAFDKTLNDGADVAFLINHTGMTLARTKPGTLKLSAVKEAAGSPVYGITGLHSEALLDPQNMYVQAMRSAVERSDLDEMSFAFRVLRQEWNQDYTRRWINEVSLDKGDVSLVNYAASPATGGTVSLRQRHAARGTVVTPRAVLAIVAEASAEFRAGKTISADTASKLAGIHPHLEAMGDAADGIRSIADDLIAMSSGSDSEDGVDDGDELSAGQAMGLFREFDGSAERAKLAAMRYRRAA